MRPDAQAIADALSVSGLTPEVSEETLGVIVRVPAAKVATIVSKLVEAGACDFLVDLFATDTGERLQLTYHLRMLETRTEFYLRAEVAYDGEAPSVWTTFPAALYAEREIAELFGMSFAGHPNPKRLLTSDDVDAYLLRKSTLIRDDEGVQRHAR